MAIGKINFEIVAPSHTALVIKNFEVDFTQAGSNMPSNLDPRNTSSTRPRLIDGEWMALTSANKLIRTAYGLTAGDNVEIGQCASYPLWSPVGDYSVQAISMMPVVFIGTFEAWTQMYVYSGSSSTPLSDFAVGDRLVAATGQPDADSSDKHSALIRKFGSNQIGQIAAEGMVVARVLGKDNTRGLHIYAQAGGFGVWF